MYIRMALCQYKPAKCCKKANDIHHYQIYFYFIFFASFTKITIGKMHNIGNKLPSIPVMISVEKWTYLTTVCKIEANGAYPSSPWQQIKTIDIASKRSSHYIVSNINFKPFIIPPSEPGLCGA